MEDKRKNSMEFEDVYSNSDDMEFEDIFSTSNNSSNSSNRVEDIYSSKKSSPVSAFDESVEDAFNSLPKYKKNYEQYNSYSEDDLLSDIPVARRPQQPQTNNRVHNGDVYMSNKRRPQPADDFEFDEEFEDISSSAKAPRPKNKKKKRKARGCLTSVIAVFLVLVIAIGVGANAFLNKLLSGITYSEDGRKENVYVNSESLYQSKDVTNILLLGVDRRNDNEESRADTMMLLSIDKQNKKLKLTSFLRDSYVDIPDEGYARLNSASTYGGPDLVMDTIEYNFNIKIDNYVLVDFNMFSEIVDKLGGVDVEVTQKEADFMASRKHGAPETPVYLKEGVNTLDGYSALWYCRIRYLDSDFFRTERQRKVVTSIINKAKSKNVMDLLDIVKSVMPLVETGFKQKEVKKIAWGAVSYLGYDIEQQQIPADGTWKSMTTKSGASVLSLDMDENKKILYDFIYSKESKDKTEDASSTEN